MIPHFTKTLTLSDGRKIIIETGKLARQADGAVTIRMGDAVLLATVVAKTEPEEGVDFLPLSVEYQEKFAAAGKIPGGFLKREGKLSDHEVLVSRLIDRAIRPLFPKNHRCATQVNVILISADANVMPDTLAALSVSIALLISNSVPFTKPISEVRVVRVDGKLFINPSYEHAKLVDIDIMVAATEDSVLMVEGEMNNVKEAELVEAIKFAHAEIALQCRAQLELVQELNIEKNIPVAAQSDFVLDEKKQNDIYAAVCEIVRQGIDNKKNRKQAFKNLLNAELLGHEDDKLKFEEEYYSIEKKAIRAMALNEQRRLDGRKLNQVRPIACEVGYIPSAHGSALFTRGDTQSLTTATLGGRLDEQLIDSVSMSGYNKFILHYNFPGFCTGEVKPNRGASRREIGHGNLAMRALKKVLPSESQNPYTIRVVSDILESNGSSSMATVCAGSLALMDAGIALSAPVAGIAMGLIVDGAKYAVLSDILGDEDALGDMDFKVTGTETGITACQMDIKISGLSYEILQKALGQAREGRLHILSEMAKALEFSRETYKPHAPRIVNITINKKLIGAVIGPGGRVIQDIQKKTGATLMVEEKDDFGVVQIFSPSATIAEAAEKMVRDIVAEPEVGGVYKGKVKSILDFGAFIEFMPGKDGLLHISEVRWGDRIEDLSSVLQEGEEIQVKLLEIDPKSGKYRLSRKALLPRPE